MMKSIAIEKPIVMADLIDSLKSGSGIIDDLCLYTDEEIEVITPETICYLDRYPEIVNDEEVHSDFVNSNELELLYYGQQFKDALTNVYKQKETANIDVVVQALNYYLDNDDFFDIV
ncbi:Uncharacterized protein ALO39_04241 [Pseudomonas syringae pv. lapsa]|nr:Uncharacterized protein ALO39_04241 [Pseudomonas syringae pv. lapsa]